MQALIGCASIVYGYNDLNKPRIMCDPKDSDEDYAVPWHFTGGLSAETSQER